MKRKWVVSIAVGVFLGRAPDTFGGCYNTINYQNNSGYAINGTYVSFDGGSTWPQNGPSSIAIGASGSFTPYINTPGVTVTVRAWNSSQGYTTPVALGSAVCPGPGSLSTWSIYFGSPPNNQCYACLTWTNPDKVLPASLSIVAGWNGGGSSGLGTVAVAPGQTYSICYTNTTMAQCPFTLYAGIFYPGQTGASSNITATSNSGNYVGGSQTGGSGPWGTGTVSGGSDQSTNSIGSGSGATGQNINSLINALDALMVALDADLKPLNKEVTQEGLTNLLGAVNTGVQSTADRLSGATNLLAKGNGLLSEVTNRLAGASNQFQAWTSGTGTNYTFGSSATNMAGASNALVAVGVPGFDGLSSSVGSAPTLGTGSSSGMTVTICGYDLNLDPESVIPGGMGMLKAIWTFVLLAGFSVWAGRLMWEASLAFGATQTGGVPDMAVEVAGFGGNLAGVVVAGAVVVALIGLFVGAFTALFALVTSNLGLMPAASSAVGLNGNQIALYLLSSTFPVNLALSLVLARITVQLAAAKIWFIAAGAARFLLGR